MTSTPPKKLSADQLVFFHSSLHLLGQFVVALKKRFSYPDLPWVHAEDENITGLFIHTELEEGKSTRNETPSIIVGKGSVVFQRPLIGDIDQNNYDVLSKNGTYYYGVLEADIRIHCLSENKGESSLLGDIVHFFIGCSRQALCRGLTLLDISQAVLQPAQQYDRDTKRWSTVVTFRVIYERRWYSVPGAPPLRQIIFDVQEAFGGDDAATLLRQIIGDPHGPGNGGEV